MLLESFGTLRYTETWAVLDVEEDLVKYYRSLIPKSSIAKPPMFPAHVTVIRKGIEVVDLSKRPRSGAVMPFLYNNVLRFDGVYWYMDVHSAGIGAVRQSLGLPQFRAPFLCYHLTVANTK